MRADHIEEPQYRHRALFLSDLHLGALGSRADLMLRFLRRNRAETYYLVGDILDIWHPILPIWSTTHQEVIDHLRQRHAAGARVVYVRGNHDPDPETAPPAKRLPVVAADQAVHVGADGRRYLVIHGDRQDLRLLRWHLLTRIGSRIDHVLRQTDRQLRRLFAATPPNRRSVIEWLLASVNTALYPRRGHERRLVALADGLGLDGVICGHFHMAALHDRHGTIYANCGDWVDSFSALAEDFAGGLHMLGGRAALEHDGAADALPAGAFQA